MAPRPGQRDVAQGGRAEAEQVGGVEGDAEAALVLEPVGKAGGGEVGRVAPVALARADLRHGDGVEAVIGQQRPGMAGAAAGAAVEQLGARRRPSRAGSRDRPRPAPRRRGCRPSGRRRLERGERAGGVGEVEIGRRLDLVERRDEARGVAGDRRAGGPPAGPRRRRAGPRPRRWRPGSTPSRPPSRPGRGRGTWPARRAGCRAPREGARAPGSRSRRERYGRDRPRAGRHGTSRRTRARRRCRAAVRCAARARSRRCRRCATSLRRRRPGRSRGPDHRPCRAPGGGRCRRRCRGCRRGSGRRIDPGRDRGVPGPARRRAGSPRPRAGGAGRIRPRP